MSFSIRVMNSSLKKVNQASTKKSRDFAKEETSGSSIDHIHDETSLSQKNNDNLLDPVRDIAVYCSQNPKSSGLISSPEILPSIGSDDGSNPLSNYNFVCGANITPSPNSFVPSLPDTVLSEDIDLSEIRKCSSSEKKKKLNPSKNLSEPITELIRPEFLSNSPWLRCLLALLYRHAMGKWRTPFSSLIEFIIPIIIALLLLWPRSTLEFKILPALNYLSEKKWENCPLGLYGPRLEGIDAYVKGVFTALNITGVSTEDILCDRFTLPIRNKINNQKRDLTEEINERDIIQTHPTMKTTNSNDLLNHFTNPTIRPNTIDLPNIHSPHVQPFRDSTLQQDLQLLLDKLSLFPFIQRRRFDGLHLISLMLTDNICDAFIFSSTDHSGCDTLATRLDDFLLLLLPSDSSTTIIGDICAPTKKCNSPKSDLLKIKLNNTSHRLKRVKPDNPVFAVRRYGINDGVTVVFECRAFRSNYANIAIRLNPLSYESAVPAVNQKYIPFDNKDIVHNGFFAAQYGGTISGWLSPSFLDFHSLIGGLILNETTSSTEFRQYLQQKQQSYEKKKISPREVELFRLSRSIFEPFSLLQRNEQTSLLLLRSMCLICHQRYDLWEYRHFEGCYSFDLFLRVLDKNINQQWQELIKADAERLHSKSDVFRYCSKKKIREFFDNFNILQIGENRILEEMIQKTAETIFLLKEKKNLNEFSKKLPKKENDAVRNLEASLNENKITFLITELFLSNLMKTYAEEIMHGALGSDYGLHLFETGMVSPPATFDTLAMTFLRANIWGLVWGSVFLFPLWRIIQTIMHDKELQIKQIFKVFGASESVIWAALYLFYGLWFGAFSLALGAAASLVHSSTSIWVLFPMFWCFTLTCISFGVLITSFFSKGSTAAVAGIGLYCAILNIYLAVETSSRFSTTQTKKIIMLFFPCGLCWSLQTILGEQIARFGKEHGGVSVNTIEEKYMGISVTDACVFLLVDTVLYFVIGCYIHQLFPGELEAGQRWYFPFTYQFWKELCPCWLKKNQFLFKKKLGRQSSSRVKQQLLVSPRNNNQEKDTFENVYYSKNRKKIIQLHNLQHNFPIRNCIGRKQDVFQAVKGLGVDIYEGEIFALLGQNGAGKTTTINMIAGLVPISGGSASIMGYDVQTQINEARKYIGFCPQFNILFDFLTVTEHLIFYSLIKGVPYQTIHQEIIHILSILNMTDKSHALSKTLSGGQKRRLSVAIAITGGAKAIFLDEPSTGMDPYTRRALWDTLKAIKKNRAIILTTHFMEEADILGDRVAIMVDGLFRCIGTPLFLKSKLGVGYQLIITKSKSFSIEQYHLLYSLITTTLIGSSLVSDVALELVFKVPFSIVESFPNLLEKLERSSSSLGIDSFSISVTTLEDVFLKICNDTVQIDDHSDVTEIKESHRPLFPYSSQMVQPDTEMKQLCSSEPSTDKYKDNAVPKYNELSLPDKSPDTLATVNSQISSSLYPTVDTTQTVESVSDIFSTYPSNDSSQLIHSNRRCQIARHFRALLIKRALSGIRDKQGLFCQLIIPFSIILMMVTLSVTLLNTDEMEIDPVYLLNAYPYKQLMPQTIYFGIDQTIKVPLRTIIKDTMSNCNGIFHTEFLINATTLESMETQLNYHRIHDSTPFYVSFYFEKTSTAVIHDGRYQHSFPMGINSLLDCAVGASNNGVLNQSKIVPERHVIITNFPLPRDSDFKEILYQILCTIWMITGISLIPAVWSSFVMKEVQNGTKRTQHMTGVTLAEYWGSFWIWDFCFFLIPFICILILVIICKFDIVDSYRIKVNVLAIIMFGFSMGPFTYFLAFFFSSPLAVQIIMYFLGLFIPTFIILIQTIPATSILYEDFLSYVFLLIPHVAFAQIIYRSTLYWGPIFGFYDPTLRSHLKNATVWHIRICGRPLIYLILSGILYFMIVLGYDQLCSYPQTKKKIKELIYFYYRLLFHCKKIYPERQVFKNHENASFYAIEDNDVREERHKIMEMSQILLNSSTSTRPLEDEIHNQRQQLQYSDHVLIVSGLRKLFKRKKWNCLKGPLIHVAVKDLSFSVLERQCFGLLGVNGAGKTTTIQMLIGNLLCTNGTALLGGYDINDDIRNVWNVCGYCPQFDVIFDYLTPLEHLYFFARLSNVPEKDLPMFTLRIIQTLGLQQYQHQLTRTLSGGNKRKLSIGLAFLKNPKVVFLDEPTSGVDPASRRKLWGIISQTIALSNRAVILTTHSMEECEALCDKVGIMQDGRLLCIGTPSYLKSKFGKGYQLDITLALSHLDHSNTVMKEELMQIDSKYSNISQRRQSKVASHPSFSLRSGYSSTSKNDGTFMSLHRKRSMIQSPSINNMYDPDLDVFALGNYLSNIFPGSALLENVWGRTRWVIPKTNCTLSQLFRAIEDAKIIYKIENYVVSEASLESIFLQFQTPRIQKT